MSPQALLLTLCLISLTYVSVKPDFITSSQFTAQLFTQVPNPRGLYVDSTGDILVVSAGSSGNIIALFETIDEADQVIVNQTVIVNGTGLELNHGITYNDGFLYASSSDKVFRWPYTPGQRAPVSLPYELVIHKIPAAGHQTRTLIFDADGLFYVTVGAYGQVDPDSSRARIRRFNLGIWFTFPIEFDLGEIFADGVRNEVGLAFDGTGVLWGVENAPRDIERPDLGEGNINPTNPAEDLNRFSHPPGTFYGFPYCWSTYDLPNYPRNSQFAWHTFINDGIHTDQWCQNVSNNQPAVMAMSAHSAPLGIEFYKGENCGLANGSFPCSAIGDAFVAFHGSGDNNVDIPVGYRVSWIPFDQNTLEPTGETVDIILEKELEMKGILPSCGSSCFRPVNAVFDKNGHLIISSDATNQIVKVYYNIEVPTVS